jgi:hypothetical protein
MKSKELIQQAILLSGEPDVINLLEQFLRENTVIKNHKFDLARFLDRNSISEWAKGIYHSEGYKLVTNGSVLVSVKSDYDAGYEGKIISPKGELIDAKFPNWKAVLEKTDNFSELKLKKSVSEISYLLKVRETVAKVNKNEVIMTLHHQGTISCFHAKNFSLFLMFLKQFPQSTLYIQNNTCLYARDGENLCLTVCFTAGSNYMNDYYNIISLN